MKRNIFITLLCLFTTAAYSNNIQITNVSVQSATNTIQFTVSWDNSWRSSTLNNWDAAWVFLKYYNPLALEWQSLYFTNTGNVIPSGIADMGATSGLNVGAFYIVPHRVAGQVPLRIFNLVFLHNRPLAFMI
jgi:hypothetical protein